MFERAPECALYVYMGGGGLLFFGLGWAFPRQHFFGSTVGAGSRRACQSSQSSPTGDLLANTVSVGGGPNLMKIQTNLLRLIVASAVSRPQSPGGPNIGSLGDWVGRTSKPSCVTRLSPLSSLHAPQEKCIWLLACTAAAALTATTTACVRAMPQSSSTRAWHTTKTTVLSNCLLVSVLLRAWPLALHSPSPSLPSSASIHHHPCTMQPHGRTCMMRYGTRAATTSNVNGRREAPACLCLDTCPIQ